ncbi:MAG: hypothetical protein GX612_00650 [Bacteroidales bacterium]|jgi:hypothetical protein|nr:hypothetical protein [Bacteroidales bacterium]
MKKLCIIATLFVVAIGVVMFFSCEKEKENFNTTKNSIKNQKSIEETTSFELYTPSNDSITLLLTNMTNYMNNAEENPMPNMELSKAIWIMESFFNIGICDKQNLFCDEATNSEKYELSLNFIYDKNSNIMIIGNDLQTKFHKLLNTIINDICPEYAMEFGDVYVNSLKLTENKVSIGIEVNYGLKGGTQLERNLFAEQSQAIFATFSNSVFYPASDYKDDYHADFFWVYYAVRDIYMEKVLNCRLLMGYVSNIISFDKYVLDTYYPNFKFDRSGPGSFVAHRIETISTRKGSPTLSHSDYSYYGDVYRDSIYGNIVPLIPSEFIPYKAACFYLALWPVSDMDFPTIDYHDFGIEYICKYIDITEIPRRDDLITVKFNPVDINCQCLCE